MEHGAIGAPRLRQLSRERGPYVAALVPQDTQKEPVMGLGKKAKREAKAVKGKTKKDLEQNVLLMNGDTILVAQ